MTISETGKNKVLEYLITALAVLLIFRKPATYFIIVLLATVLFFYRDFSWNAKKWKYTLIIASPFLLDILFFWNNESLLGALKHGEKSAALLLLPIIILGWGKSLNVLRILRCYARLSTVVLLGCLVRFALLFPDLFNKYLAGRDLFEMGYRFAESFGEHAPAINMHVAFIAVVHFYFFLKGFVVKGKKHQLFINLVFFIFTLPVLFYLNTRMAIMNAFLGILLVAVYEVFTVFRVRKLLIVSCVALFVAIASFAVFVKVYPHIIDKFTTLAFRDLDKVGHLDDIEDPNQKVFGSLVTRLSIWKSTLDLSRGNLIVGTGAADGKGELVDYFRKTDQHFLAEYKFPVHNQYLDFLLKFGVLGLLAVLMYIGLIAFFGFRLKSSIILFFFWLFFTSNLFDDYLIRFDGIVFSALWVSLFAYEYLTAKSLKQVGI